MTVQARKDEVLRYLGYAGQVMTDDLEQRLDQAIAVCAQDVQPAGYFQVHPLRAITDETGAPAQAVEGTPLVLRGVDIAEYLQGATHCALMVCTMGLKSERSIQRLSKTSALEALIYASACTDMVERGADQIEAQVVAYAHDRKLFTNYRYSPGYGDFDLSIQPAFIRTLEADKRLGITVTPQNIMVPTKTITAVVGMYPHRPPKAKVGCGQCNCRDWCTIRAAGQRCFSGKTRVDDAIDE